MACRPGFSRLGGRLALRDDVRTYSGDVSQILVDGLCVVGRKEWLQRNAWKSDKREHRRASHPGLKKLVEATEVDKRGFQCRVVSHGSQCGLDLTARESV